MGEISAPVPSKRTPEQRAPYRRFKTRPSNVVLGAFLTHVRETGQPETFPGIYTDPLDRKEEFFKLKEFEVNRKKRAGEDMAPCPMCHSPNKYISGVLVYLPRIYAMAAIGHECADPANRHAADREFRARQAQEREETYLLSHLPHVSWRLHIVDLYRPTAIAQLRLYRTIRREVQGIHQSLREVKKRGGILTVEERVSRDIASIGSEHIRALPQFAYARSSNRASRRLDFDHEPI